MSEGFKHGYALLIGVGGDLVQTRNDAKALYKLLTNTQRAGYPSSQVELLTDETEPKATRQAILEAFNRLSQRVAQDPEATVFIYYSGHGHEFVINHMPVGHYLLPLNYNLADLNNTAISGKVFTDKLKEIKAKKQIVFLDCCFAAGISKMKDELVESQPQNMPAELKALELGSGQVVVASCDASEKSVTDSEHSVFTRALLDALDGKAYSWDGFARFTSVLGYLFQQVPVLASQYQVTQNVVLKMASDLKGDFALCRLPGAIQETHKPDARFSHLYKAMLPIGFSKEQLVFSRLRKLAITNAYLIQGQLWYGHYWLLRNLLSELYKEGVFPYKLDMARSDLRVDVDCVWSDLCLKLENCDDKPKEEISQAVADALENRPVALILENVQYMQPAEISNLMDHFWKPLADGVYQKLKDKSPFRLYLFLVYIEEMGKSWPLALPEKTDRVEPPYYMQGFQLPTIQEEIAFTWMTSEKVASLLAEKGCVPASGDISPVFDTLWNASKKGIPEEVARQFFKLLNAKYRGYDQWLTI